MQDFTGVPAVVDLAAMRDGMKALGGDPEKINPLVPVDLVIDHSVIVDEFGTPDGLRPQRRARIRAQQERYKFLKWGQQAFDNFRVVPPGTGICHQVNLEYLARPSGPAKTVDGEVEVAYPDTCVGTDSHTTMINGLGVLGWGVGGIEAEAAMLGQPVSMLLPEVIGFKLTGKLKEGVTATDLVLTVTQMLRKKGVVGKFVEFFGPGLDNLTLADRATIGNMAPEYGATCGFFPVDARPRYLNMSGRAEPSASRWSRPIPRRRACSDATRRRSGVHRHAGARPRRRRAVDGRPEASRRPRRRSKASQPASPPRWRPTTRRAPSFEPPLRRRRRGRKDFDLGHGDVVIAAITSCTNTSNPSVLIGAGLLARNAKPRA
jgi:aconitate hydratase